jgi:hypothetical protein
MAIDLGPSGPRPPALGDDSNDLASLGYEQELHRSLGPFASFAAGFSFVSILTTVFQRSRSGSRSGGRRSSGRGDTSTSTEREAERHTLNP